jgi:hypothetical protein
MTPGGVLGLLMEPAGHGHSARIFLPDLKFSPSRRNPDADFILRRLVCPLLCSRKIPGMVILPGYVCPLNFFLNIEEKPNADFL